MAPPKPSGRGQRHWSSGADWELLEAEVWHQLPPLVRDQEATVAIRDSGRVLVLSAERQTPSGPQGRRLATSLERHLGQGVRLAAASSMLVASWRKRYEDFAGELGALAEDGEGQAALSLGSESGESGASQAVVRLVRQALDARATDLHIERRDPAQGGRSRIRMRVGGEMLEADHALDEAGLEAVANYLFSQGRRGNSHWQPDRPQDGVVDVAVEQGVQVQLRIASIPEVRGWDIVLRVIQTDAPGLRAEQLGYLPEHLDLLRMQLASGSGVVLFAGPTGSGKTTAMLALLEELPPHLKIASLEQPAERLLGNVSHVTAPSAERLVEWMPAINRWDCDMAVLGELRDPASARVLANFVSSGRMTLATVHASGATSVPMRLLYLGVDPNLLASSGFLRAVLFQRLLPRLCEHCRKPMVQIRSGKGWEARLHAKLRKLPDFAGMFRRGPGCERCSGGLSGRVLAAEVLVPGRQDLPFLARDRLNAWPAELEKRGWRGVGAHGYLLAKQGLIDPLDGWLHLGGLQPC